MASGQDDSLLFLSLPPPLFICSRSPMNLLFSRRFSGFWWVYFSFFHPEAKLNLECVNKIKESLFPARLLIVVEQHSRGWGAAWRAHGAGVSGPHQQSAAQSGSGGQLLRCRHPCTSDVTRKRGLGAQPQSSVLTAWAIGRDKQA